MSQLQGNSLGPANKTSYWPGHVIAESLIDENDANDSIFDDEVPKKKQSEKAKSRNSSMSSGNQNKLSRNSSQQSAGGSISEFKNSKDINNNVESGSGNGDFEKKIIRQKMAKIKPGKNIPKDPAFNTPDINHFYFFF